MKIVQIAGREALGEFAPDFARYNDDVLFGEVWSSEVLPLRERSLITIASLMGRGVVDSSFQYHLVTAKKNGITKSEIAEVITQLAFYIGWPVAWAAFRQAQEVWSETMTLEDEKAQYQNSILFPIGEPNTAFAPFFVGQSYLATVANAQLPIYHVTFEPGCRNNWHVHHAKTGGGQMLICTGGSGWYQLWGEPPVKLEPGMVISIPAEKKHWHGAAADSWFSHLAFDIPGQETNNEWLEPVADYAGANGPKSNQ